MATMILTCEARDCLRGYISTHARSLAHEALPEYDDVGEDGTATLALIDQAREALTLLDRIGWEQQRGGYEQCEVELNERETELVLHLEDDIRRTFEQDQRDDDRAALAAVQSLRAGAGEHREQPMTTSVTFLDSSRRRALNAALLHAANVECKEIGALSGHLWGCAADMIREGDADLELIEETSRALRSLLDRLAAVRRSKVDATLVLDVEPAVLVDALRNCKEITEEWEDFWKRPAAARNHAAWARDAAVELIEQIAVEAVA